MSNSKLQYGGGNQGQGSGQGQGGGGNPQGSQSPQGQPPTGPGGPQPGGPQQQPPGPAGVDGQGDPQPQSIEEWVQQYDDPDQLVEKMDECFVGDTGQFKGDRKPVAQAIARYSSVFNDELIKQIRRNASLLPYLMYNPNFSQERAEDLLEAVVGAMEGAPDKISSQPERLRGQVAQHAGQAVESLTLSENNKTIPQAVEEKLEEIFQHDPDKGWGLESPRRSGAGFALAAIKVDRDPQELIDFYQDLRDQEGDLGGFSEALLRLDRLPIELVETMMDEQPSDDLYSKIAGTPRFVVEHEDIRKRIRTSDFEAAIATLTALASSRGLEEEVAPTFQRLLELDPTLAAKVFQEEKIRQHLDQQIFEDELDGLIDAGANQNYAVLLDMLQRGEQLVKPALTEDRFRRLFEQLQQHSQTAAVQTIEICSDIAQNVITAEDMEPLVTSPKGNVRTQAIILCRELDIDVDEEKLTIDSVFTRQGLASWLQEQVDRDGAEERILNYLDVAEEITGGRQKEGDRFHQSVVMAAHMTFQPSQEFIETIDQRWPWAVPDLVRNNSLPEQGEEWLWEWAEEYLGELEEAVQQGDLEGQEEFLRKRGLPSVQLAGGLTKWQDQEETDQLGERFIEIIEDVPTDKDHELGSAVRRQLMKTLLGIQVSDENILQRAYQAGGDDIKVARVIAAQPGISTDLLREIFEDWSDDLEIQQVIASHPELQNDPEIRDKLRYVEDPEVLINMMFDRQSGEFRLEDGEFRGLWLQLRNVDGEKAAQVLANAPPQATRELYMEDIKPMLRASSKEIRVPASMIASEVKTGSPPDPSRENPSTGEEVSR